MMIIIKFSQSAKYFHCYSTDIPMQLKGNNKKLMIKCKHACSLSHHQHLPILMQVLLECDLRPGG